MDSFTSGFVSLLGRPNVGKSSIVNALVGSKVAITSDRPQTTRAQIRGIMTDDHSQVIFTDTPGVHKPRTKLGDRTNALAIGALGEADLAYLVIPMNEKVGPGDRYLAKLLGEAGSKAFLVLSKSDLKATSSTVAEAQSLYKFEGVFQVSALLGAGLDELAEATRAAMPLGPRLFPADMVTDQNDLVLVAELVRETLIRQTHQELPHSIAVVADWRDELTLDEAIHGKSSDESRDDTLRFDVTVMVERDSQKGMVIGKGGSLIKGATSHARKQLEKIFSQPVNLKAKVRVQKDWQNRNEELRRLGF